MEWCADMPRNQFNTKRLRALRVAKVLMKDWVVYEREVYGNSSRLTSAAARRIERVWAAYIKTLTL
jgi:hypothetical protein